MKLGQPMDPMGNAQKEPTAQYTGRPGKGNSFLFRSGQDDIQRSGPPNCPPGTRSASPTVKAWHRGSKLISGEGLSCAALAARVGGRRPPPAIPRKNSRKRVLIRSETAISHGR